MQHSLLMIGVSNNPNAIVPTPQCFLDLGFSVYGGSNAPYVWVGFPGKASWYTFCCTAGYGCLCYLSPVSSGARLAPMTGCCCRAGLACLRALD